MSVISNLKPRKISSDNTIVKSHVTAVKFNDSNE